MFSKVALGHAVASGDILMRDDVHTVLSSGRHMTHGPQMDAAVTYEPHMLAGHWPGTPGHAGVHRRVHGKSFPAVEFGAEPTFGRSIELTIPY